MQQEGDGERSKQKLKLFMGEAKKALKTVPKVSFFRRAIVLFA